MPFDPLDDLNEEIKEETGEKTSNLDDFEEAVEGLEGYDDSILAMIKREVARLEEESRLRRSP